VADAARRAFLTREVAKAIASDWPLDDIWPRCAPALAELAGAASISIALRRGGRDLIAFAPGPASDADVIPGTLLARTLDAGTLQSRDGDDPAVCIPICWATTVLGAIELDGLRACGEEELALLESCAFQIAARLDRDFTLDDSVRLERLAFVDALTGIANRRAFDEALARDWAIAAREGRNLGLLMIDVDFFKLYNDAYGHPAGDTCLRRVASAIAGCVSRGGDIAARYGGEEFVVLLPKTAPDGVTAIAIQICGAVETLAIPHTASSLGRITISVGTATCVPAHDESPHTLLHAADDALYRAKHAGRNCVAGAGYASQSQPAYPARSETHDHLPLQLASLVGRQTERAELEQLLDGHRLVTLVGIGGAGKTRLAVEVARALASRFDDGAHLVDLSPLHETDDIAQAVANLLDVRTALDEPVQALATALSDRNILIVLDNCDHVVAKAAALAATLLRRCPRLCILATSREPLGITGESVYAVPLLPVPPPGLSLEKALTNDAVALFVERATAARIDFQLTRENVEGVAAICRSLEGIPLAIELAAARSGYAATAQIARTVDARQRTMTATIDWSYELLSRREQRTFRRLSIFAGEFTMERAIEIASKTRDDRDEVFDVVVSLVRKSLVASAGEGRYRLLETLRRYAFEKLVAGGRFDRVARRHARAFARVAQQARALWGTGAVGIGGDALRPDFENLRAAIAWAFDDGNDVELGVRMIGDLANVLAQLAPAEGLRRARQALVADPSDGGVWLTLAVAIASLGLPPREQLDAAERARDIFTRAGDRAGTIEAGIRVATAYSGLQRHDEAQTTLARTLAAAREMHDPRLEWRILSIAAKLSYFASDWEATRATAVLLLDQARNEGGLHDVAESLLLLGEAEFALGNVHAAVAYAQEGLLLGSSARQHLQFHVNVCAYLVACARYGEARQAGSEAMRLARVNDFSLAIVLCVQHLALAVASSGDARRAATLLGFANAGYARHEFSPGFTERYTRERLSQTIAQHLTPDDIAGLGRKGAAMGPDEAAREALRE
jgi:diguanylate cyclase (GGDEF)-like protein